MQRLCYVSQANFQAAERTQVLADILTTARNFNAYHAIQGVLYFADDCFLQCLEAKEADLTALMQNIQNDQRHSNLHIVLHTNIDTPIFNDWSMKFVSRQHQVKRFFKDQGYSNFCPEKLSKPQLEQLIELLYQLEV